MSDHETNEISIQIMENYHYFNNYENLIVYARKIMNKFRLDKKLASGKENISTYMKAYLAYIDACRLIGNLEYIFRFSILDVMDKNPIYKVESVFENIPEDLLNEHHLKLLFLNANILMDSGYFNQANLSLKPIINSMLDEVYPKNNLDKDKLNNLSLLKARFFSLNGFIQLKLNNFSKMEKMNDINLELMNLCLENSDAEYPQEKYDLMFDILYLKIFSMIKMKKSQEDIENIYRSYLNIFNFNPDFFSTEQSAISYYLKYISLKEERPFNLKCSGVYYSCTNIPRNIKIVKYQKNENDTSYPSKCDAFEKADLINFLKYIPSSPQDLNAVLNSMLLVRPASI